MGENKDRQHDPSIIQALETVSEGISVLNDEGKFEYVNQEYADLFKYNKEELIGQNMNEVGIGDRPNLFQDKILPELKEKGEWKGIITCTRKDGTKFLAEHSISMTEDEGTVSAITDNTVHEVYQTLVRNFPEGGVAIFDKELDYIMASGETPEWNKLVPSKAEGESVETIYSDENLETVKAHYEAALDGKSNTFRIKLDSKWYMFRVLPLEDREGGNVFSGMVISQDITTMKEREENLKEFNSMVGHDLKNPLNTSLGYLGLQQEKESTREIERAIDSLKKMNQIIDDIAVTTKDPSELQMKGLNLKNAFENGLSSVEHKLESYEVEDIVVKADKGQMARMFANLISNSIEHNEQSVNIKVGKMENGFYYEDDGKGIPEGIKGEIFQKGMTTSETEYGIGMYLVRRIVEIHNWSIEVTESENGGARFEIRTSQSTA